jgi:hypothetical protein
MQNTRTPKKLPHESPFRLMSGLGIGADLLCFAVSTASCTLFAKKREQLLKQVLRLLF